MFKTVIAAAAVLAAGSSFAASVSLYGVVDTGFTYTHVNHGNDSLEMSTGNYAGSRFGLKGTEEIAPGYAVNFILEAGFLSDSGEFGEAGKIFNRESLISISAPWGTLGAGRTGPFTSGTGSLSRYWDLEPFETGYTDAGIQATQVNIWSRNNNTIYYVTPKIAGLEAGVQYSFSGSQDQETDGMADDDHFANVYVRWDGNTLKVAGGVEVHTIGHNNDKTDPNKTRWSVKLAGAWTPFNGATTLFAGYNYYKNQAKFSDVSWNDDVNLRFDGSGKGLEAHSGYLGVRYKIGAASLLGQVQYLNGKNEGAKEGDDDSYERFVVSVGSHYFFSKRTMGYLVASYAKGSGLLDLNSTTTNRIMGHVGITHWF